MLRQKESRASARIPKKPLIIAVTGSFGSGKTTVASIFKEFGCRLIDADKIAHACIMPGKKSYKDILRYFGKSILTSSGAIDRSKLGEEVFNNKKHLKKLNAVIHPHVIAVIKDEIKKCKHRVIVLDAPLLIESGLRCLADIVIVVNLSEAKQIERLRRKTGISLDQIKKRIKAQLPLSKKVRLADFIIDNNANIAQTRKQAEQIRRKLWKSWI